jgi:hypothetical protein
MIIASFVFGTDPDCSMVVTVDMHSYSRFVVKVAHSINGVLEQRNCRSAAAALAAAQSIGAALYDDVLENEIA